MQYDPTTTMPAKSPAGEDGRLSGGRARQRFTEMGMSVSAAYRDAHYRKPELRF
jgi:hypothetical protein